MTLWNPHRGTRVCFEVLKFCIFTISLLLAGGLRTVLRNSITGEDVVNKPREAAI